MSDADTVYQIVIVILAGVWFGWELRGLYESDDNEKG